MKKGEIMLTRDIIRENFQKYKIGRSQSTDIEFVQNKCERNRLVKIVAQTEQRRMLAQKWS